MEKLDSRSCLEEEMLQVCLDNGIKKFRASQVFHWIQGKGVHDWDEMMNIAKVDREKLRDILKIERLQIVGEQQSKDGTRKFLLRLADGLTIECVLMGYENTFSRDRQTICLSTQVGCPVGCSFCATGLAGFQRNLTVGEITGQVLDVMRHLRKEDPEFKVSNLVYMGMGEPFLNYENVMKSIQILNNENGQNIGMRKITISTSGVVPRIKQLARDNPQVGLAISLHAAKDEVRDHLVPMNKKYPLAKLIQACKNYIEVTNRRITFEVALSDQNTEKKAAEEIVELLKGLNAHVNLILVNPVVGSRVKRPAKEKVFMFKKVLEAGKIPVSIREEKGIDIDAACGQLRQRMECEEYEFVDQS